MENKFQTKFEKVVGGTEEERVKAKEKLQKLLEEPHNKDLKSYEVNLTEKDKEIIQDIESSVDNVASSYGGSPIPFPPEKIYVLKNDGVEAVTDTRFFGGFHSPLGQRIVIEKGHSDIDFATTLAHELFHVKSYKA